MAFNRKSNGKGPTGTGPLPGITAENYIIPDIRDFEKATGKGMDYARNAGASFMIYPDMTSERAAWLKYYRIKGMKKQIKGMHRFLDRDGIPTIHGINERRWAVPAQWPWQFDQSIDEGQCR